MNDKLKFILERAIKWDLDISREPIDVTCAQKHDESWKQKCKCGITHKFDKTGNIVTAKWIEENHYDDGDEYTVSVPYCAECGERIFPKYTSTQYKEYIAVPTECILNASIWLNEEEARLFAEFAAEKQV